jgi:hypothetical protein
VNDARLLHVASAWDCWLSISNEAVFPVGSKISLLHLIFPR